MKTMTGFNDVTEQVARAWQDLSTKTAKVNEEVENLNKDHCRIALLLTKTELWIVALIMV